MRRPELHLVHNVPAMQYIVRHVQRAGKQPVHVVQRRVFARLDLRLHLQHRLLPRRGLCDVQAVQHELSLLLWASQHPVPVVRIRSFPAGLGMHQQLSEWNLVKLRFSHVLVLLAVPGGYLCQWRLRWRC